MGSGGREFVGSLVGLYLATVNLRIFWCVGVEISTKYCPEAIVETSIFMSSSLLVSNIVCL